LVELGCLHAKEFEEERYGGATVLEGVVVGSLQQPHVTSGREQFLGELLACFHTSKKD
jgi:hypothetical protein